jgi:hypothetical protein
LLLILEVTMTMMKLLMMGRADDLLKDLDWMTLEILRNSLLALFGNSTQVSTGVVSV